MKIILNTKWMNISSGYEWRTGGKEVLLMNKWWLRKYNYSYDKNEFQEVVFICEREMVSTKLHPKLLRLNEKFNQIIYENSDLMTHWWAIRALPVLRPSLDNRLIW